MGVGPFHFSSSAFDHKSCHPSEPIKPKFSNPNPNNYKVIKFREFTRFHKVLKFPGGEITTEPLYNRLVVDIEYPDCTNFEGRKILYFEDCTMDQLLKQKTIDPHFSENPNFKSPSARFEPTLWGWKMACRFANRFVLRG